MSKLLAAFDKEYFENYGNSGLSYDKVYNNFGFYLPHIIRDYKRNNLMPESILDCGCSYGKTVEEFRKYKIKAYGIEISTYAYNKIPESVKSYCWLFDMRNFNQLSKNAFDSGFFNSLMYLTEDEILEVLTASLKVFRRSIYIVTPYEDYPESIPLDKERKTLKPKKWWIDNLKAIGWTPLIGTNLFKKA